MFVDHLQLADFRSYVAVDLPLAPGVTTFVGANGQGKTNLVEAVDYLATLGSHRVANEVPLVRIGAERAVIRARVQAGLDDPRILQLEVEITPGRANRARLNRSALSRPRDLLGALRTVLFSPEDLALVKGDPSERRRFLDDVVTARWPRLAGVRADYDRVLRQRTSLLKSLSGRRGTPPPDAAATLDVWDDQFAAFGAEVMHARVATLTDLGPHVAKAYADIAPTNNLACTDYKTALPVPPGAGRAELTEGLRSLMAQRRAEEIARGVSLVGPHRDDIMLAIGDLPAKGYASHGESWSLALALKLASFALLRTEGMAPVLLLDDVFAELDATRRFRLASGVADAEQVLVTAAVPADVPDVLRGARCEVAAGDVRRRGDDDG